MRRKVAAGNWKMNGLGADLAEVTALLADLPAGCEVMLCLPATLIERAARLVAGRVTLGGQDCHAATNGAHTGDIAAAMLADAGATQVILGHSERRADHGESDAQVAAKVTAAQAAGLGVILCLGETAAERAAGETLGVVAQQLTGSLPEEVDPAQLIVAYEPVWAIGSGAVPTMAEIAAVHAELRTGLAGRFGGAGDQVPLLYGGSVKPENAAEIFAVPGVDGALVGGASLTAAGFRTIIVALAGAGRD